MRLDAVERVFESSEKNGANPKPKPEPKTESPKNQK